MTPALLHHLILAVADDVIAHADELTELDRAVGDGDHGINMKRGFEAVRADAGSTAEKPLPDALKAIGTQLVMKVGGASGPLYGTLFLALSKEIAPDASNLPTAFAKAVEAVKARGKSQPGQKTMLDVLAPVQTALAEGGATCPPGCRVWPPAPRTPQSPCWPLAAARRSSASARSGIWTPAPARRR